MADFIYRLDLSEEEFNKIKNNLEDTILNKIKKIKISEKKVDSMRRAVNHKKEIARARFFDALIYLNENDIEATQYNMKKYKQIPYQTSKKYFDLLSLKDEYEDIDYYSFTDEKIDTQTYEDLLEMIAYEKSLVEQWENRKKKEK